MLSTSITVTDCDDVSVEKNSSDEYRVKDSGISTAKLADGAVVAAKMTAVNVISSSSSGNYNSNDMTSSWNDVTNLSISITTSGRPVVIMLIPDGSTNGAKIESYASSSWVSLVRFLRDGTEVYRNEIQASGSGPFTYESSSALFIHCESVAAATYNYKVQVKSTTTSNTWVKYMKVVAYELP